MSSRSVGEVASTSFVREPSRTGHAEIASKLAHRHGSWRDQVLFPVRDGAVIYLTVVISLLLFSADISNRESIRPALVALWGSGIFGYALGYSAFVVLVLKWHRYYIPLPVDSLFDETVLVCKCVSISIMVLLSTLYLVGKRVSGAGGLLVILVIHVSYLLAARVRRSSRLARGIEAGWLGRNALIVGSGEVAHALATHFERNPNLGYVVRGFLDETVNGTRLLGRHEDLYRVIQTHFIDEVFITTPMQRDLIKRLTLDAPEYHVNVTVVPDLYDGIGWHTPVSRIGYFPVMHLHREDVHSFQLFVKRIIDIVGSGLTLLLLSPLMLVVALIVKLNSAGPVFYRARRVGKKGNIFECLKFRTMLDDADKMLDKLAHLNERNGPLFKMSDDPRVTSVGRLLRRHSLDELPQLLNVLKGEMSLVGPRPPEIQEYLQFQVEHLRKLEVMPGITGLWQISARQDPSFENYIKCDLEYIENWSVWMDLAILARTIPVVFAGTGK